MTPEKWIAAKIRESGLKIYFVAEKAGMDAKNLSATLNSRRKFKVEEFLSVCKALGLDPAEYKHEGEKANA